MDPSPTPSIRLLRKLDRVFLRSDDGTDQPVRLAWARPVSGRGSSIAILDEKKKEIVLLPDLAALDPESRRVAEEELCQRYLMPKIRQVIRTQAHLGTRYWEVETDHGPRHFVVRNPNRDVLWLTDDHLVLRDPLGNRFEIESLAALDARSRTAIERVI